MLNEILQRAMGESYASKYIADNRVNNYAESYSDSLYIKNKRLASENIDLRNAINGLVDNQRGVITASGELTGPIKVGRNINLKKLLSKGYTINGMSQKEAENILNESGVKGVANLVSKFLTKTDIRGLNRAAGKVLLDDEGKIKIEYVNKPELIQDKLRALMTRNNEISDLMFNIRAVSSLCFILNPILIPGLVIFDRIFGVISMKIFLNFYGFIFRPVRDLSERYIDSATSLALAKDVREMVDDLIDQAKKLNDTKVLNNMNKNKKVLDKYIQKETKRCDSLARKLEKRLKKNNS